MSLSSIELSSSALVKLGANGIGSFTDGTAEARVAETLYPLVRDAMLCAHPWSFATAKTALTQLPTPPVTDFTYAYQLPADFLKALSAGDEVKGRGLTYRIVGQELHTDADEVVLTYLFRPLEDGFPAYFVPVLVTKLAAEFCIPLTENTARSEALSRQAGSELKLAKLIDSQQATPQRVEDFSLIRARFG